MSLWQIFSSFGSRSLRERSPRQAKPNPVALDSIPSWADMEDPDHDKWRMQLKQRGKQKRQAEEKKEAAAASTSSTSGGEEKGSEAATATESQQAEDVVDADAPLPPCTCQKSGYQVNEEFNRKIYLYHGDIAALQVDAIVNAANAGLIAGGGVCGRIFDVAGERQLQAACRRVIAAQGRVQPGEARLTKGFNLHAPYVIHTVGPLDEDPDVLREAYIATLNQCVDPVQVDAEPGEEVSIRSVAFCCISTGIYGFDNKDAAVIALKTTREWLEADPDRASKLSAIVFCTFLTKDQELYEKLTPYAFPKHEKGDKATATANVSQPEGVKQKQQRDEAQESKSQTTKRQSQLHESSSAAATPHASEAVDMAISPAVSAASSHPSSPQPAAAASSTLPASPVAAAPASHPSSSLTPALPSSSPGSLRKRKSEEDHEHDQQRTIKDSTPSSSSSSSSSLLSSSSSSRVPTTSVPRFSRPSATTTSSTGTNVDMDMDMDMAPDPFAEMPEESPSPSPSPSPPSGARTMTGTERTERGTDAAAATGGDDIPASAINIAATNKKAKTA